MANQNRADIKKGLTRTQGGKNNRALNVLVDSVANVADTSIVTGTLNNCGVRITLLAWLEGHLPSNTGWFPFYIYSILYLLFYS